MSLTINQIVLNAFIILAGGVAAVLVGGWLKRNPLVVSLLYVWHTLIGCYYSNYVLVHGGDAFVYYEKARFWSVEPTLGTDFIIWLTSFPASLGLTYWSLAFLYNAIGAIGLVFFYATLQEVAAGTTSTVTRVLLFAFAFIPSLSFWTSGIGKDSIAFLSVALFLWSSLDLRRRQIATIAAVLIIFPIRPHISGLMLIGIVSGLLITPSLRATTRLGMTLAGSIAATFAIPLALVYAGTGRFSSLGAYITDRQTQNTAGGSSLDITAMNPAMRLFTFVYRPLPNEAAGPDQIAAAMENILLLAVTVFGLIVLYRAGPVRMIRRYGIAATYGFACVLLLSQVTANLGLAMRQKWMALPALLLVILGAWHTYVEQRSGAKRVPYYGYRGVAEVPS